MNQYFITLLLLLSSFFGYADPTFEPADENAKPSKFWWQKFRGKFDRETIEIRFPEKPVIQQVESELIAFAFDWSTRYSLTAFYPPQESIDAFSFFETIMEKVSLPPYSLIDYRITRPTLYWWILDYVLHDDEKNQLVKSRVIVTKLNAYILECSIPYNTRDHFNYFLNSCSIHE